MADKIQALVGNNPMIKSVMSNPEHMAKAQEMLRNPEMQKQIGGVISNPAVIKQASEVLNGLQQMNTIQAGGRRRRRRTRKKRRKSKKRKSRRRRTGTLTTLGSPQIGGSTVSYNLGASNPQVPWALANNSYGLNEKSCFDNYNHFKKN